MMEAVTLAVPSTHPPAHVNAHRPNRAKKRKVDVMTGRSFLATYEPSSLVNERLGAVCGLNDTGYCAVGSGRVTAGNASDARKSGHHGPQAVRNQAFGPATASRRAIFRHDGRKTAGDRYARNSGGTAMRTDVTPAR